MSFALEEAKLWDHVLGTAVPPPLLHPKPDDNEERTERIYQRYLKFKEFSDDARCTVAKMGCICTETVQKEFLALKSLTTWNPKDLWEHLKTRYTLQNWASKWSTLGKLHSIHQRDCKNVAEFISKIQDVTSEITDLNITIEETIIIHTLNSLDSHFKPYLAILSHDAREKEHLPTLQSLSKALEDEEQRLDNQDKVTANFAKKEKKQDSKTGKSSAANTSSNTKSTAPYLCTWCKKTRSKGECWMDKVTCNGCGKVGHIRKYCFQNKDKEGKKNESNAITSEVSTKGLSCYLQKSSLFPTLSAVFDHALTCTMTAAAITQNQNTKVILDCRATDYFFCNREFFTTFTEHYHEFQTGSGQIVSAYGYGDVTLRLIHKNKTTNVFTIQNVS